MLGTGQIGSSVPSALTSATKADGEEIDVEVLLDDGTCLRSGVTRGYPADLDLRSMAPVLFNRLVVAIALRRMQLPRGEIQHHED